ncbi:NAD-dependent epimerase/dehydratase family protein [Kineococcus sp. GCM10028916]|uniref:NAD-dependent epimerase/dehydratase family protein n=1 Tax=Kineococcus sp. GCM10028916 TaxID=3273394 RepID=UPI003631B7DE
MDRTIVVTGATGHVGNHSLVRLLADGERVRALVRGPEGRDVVLAAVDRAGVDATALEFATATLDVDDGWNEALAGADGVLHHASPFPSRQPENPDDVIRPAREGALRVLRAAREQGVRRVVLTSSFAAVGYSRSSGGPFTEADWTDGDDVTAPPYVRSKALAERAAWAFVADGGPELAVVNPTGIFGPTLSPRLSASVAMVAALVEGRPVGDPGRAFGIVDVRDVVDLHVRALDDPGAVGRRFLASAGPAVTLEWLSRVVADRAAPDLALPGSPVIATGAARTVLGWRPRDVVSTVLDTVDSLG